MHDQRLKVIEPSYVSSFQCIGDKCPDNCCHSWNVPVSKKSYKKLKKYKDVIVRQLVDEHMSLTKKSDIDWANINMDPQGMCPALDDVGLCELHKRCGHSNLPETCQDFPRQAKLFGEQVEMSLSMACPAAAELILFDQSAMVFSDSLKKPANIMNGKAGGLGPHLLPFWLPAVRDLCFGVMLDEDTPFDVRMFSLGFFLNKASSKLASIEEVNEVIEEFSVLYNDGKLAEMYTALPSVAKLKWHVFAVQDTLLIKSIDYIPGKTDTQGMSSSAVRFQECRLALMALTEQLAKEHSQNGLSDEEAKVKAFEQMLKQAQEQYLDDYFREHPQLLTNYGLYYLYHHQFLLQDPRSLFDFFSVMAVELLAFKAYLSAMVISHKQVKHDEVIKLVQSMSRITQHKLGYVDNVLASLAENHVNSLAKILGLFR